MSLGAPCVLCSVTVIRITVRFEPSWSGPDRPCDPHDMQIGGHARSEGLIVVTNNLREFSRMPGIRVENWV